jgi:hypothetical protein
MFILSPMEYLIKNMNVPKIMKQCDNGNKTGCKTGCVYDVGYTCTGALGSPSVCSTVCGDSIKAGSEQCDNGNKIGCKLVVFLILAILVLELLVLHQPVL